MVQGIPILNHHKALNFLKMFPLMMGNHQIQESQSEPRVYYKNKNCLMASPLPLLLVSF